MKIDSLLYIITVLEFIAAIVATVYFKKYRKSSEKYFLYFLWFTFFIEAFGASLKPYYPIGVSWIYSVFSFASVIFYFFWYYQILKNKSLRRVVVVFASLFSLITTLAYILPDELKNQGYAFVVGSLGSLGILILTLCHFYRLLNSDEVLIIKHKLSFWISTGLLLFYVGIIPLVLLTKTLVISPLSRILILISLNLILYGCYVIGFIWTKKKYNRF